MSITKQEQRSARSGAIAGIITVVSMVLIIGASQLLAPKSVQDKPVPNLEAVPYELTVEDMKPHPYLVDFCKKDANGVEFEVCNGISSNGTEAKSFAPHPHDVPQAVHIIEPGDTLSSFSRQYGVKVRTLQQFNNLNSSKIRIGQVIKIPYSTD